LASFFGVFRVTCSAEGLATCTCLTVTRDAARTPVTRTTAASKIRWRCASWTPRIPTNLPVRVLQAKANAGGFWRDLGHVLALIKFFRTELLLRSPQAFLVGTGAQVPGYDRLEVYGQRVLAGIGSNL
jgi:hypothetical protein